MKARLIIALIATLAIGCPACPPVGTTLAGYAACLGGKLNTQASTILLDVIGLLSAGNSLAPLIITVGPDIVDCAVSLAVGYFEGKIAEAHATRLDLDPGIERGLKNGLGYLHSRGL